MFDSIRLPCKGGAGITQLGQSGKSFFLEVFIFPLSLATTSTLWRMDLLLTAKTSFYPSAEAGADCCHLKLVLGLGLCHPRGNTLSLDMPLLRFLLGQVFSSFYEPLYLTGHPNMAMVQIPHEALGPLRLMIQMLARG